MAMPLIIAFAILLNHERHLGLRNSLSETQRIFTSSWWTGDTDTLSARDRPRRPQVNQQGAFDPDAPLEVALATDNNNTRERALALRKRWLPASFMRFIWFCTALFIGMMAYVLGEAYAEIYLRTLPHNTVETIAYVYSWVITVHLLDGLVGWILGGQEGERVGSYPLGWIFKLYVLLPSLSFSISLTKKKILLPNLPNLRPRPLRPPPLPGPIHLPPSPLLLLPHPPRPPNHVLPIPLPPDLGVHQQPISLLLSEILRPQHLYPLPVRNRIHACFPRLDPRFTLWFEQGRLSVLCF